MTKDKDNLLFFILVLFFTIIFNFQIVKDIVFFNPETIPIDDSVVTEFLTETQYQNIRHFKNPFSPTKQIFYPFETNFVLQDTSFVNVPFLIILKPFLDIYQITQLIVLFNIVAGNFVMYLLLRRFNLSNQAAAIGALLYGFSPFLSYRVLGHLTYTTTYFFPLLFLIGHAMIKASTNRARIIVAILWGLIWAALYYANPYYFITAILGSIFLLACGLIFLRKESFQIIMAGFKLLPVYGVSFLGLMLPYFLAMNAYLIKNSIPETKGIIRPLTLSADLLNFFVPSEFNPLYNYLFDTLAAKNNLSLKLAFFFEANWGRFAYPGILILVSYVIYIFIRRRISVPIVKYVHIIALCGIMFAVLSLGPLLKVFNKWYFVLPEEISVYFPLPYLALHFIPFFDIVSAPARFITGAVFFGSILAAFIFQFIGDYLKKKNMLKLFIIVLTIFIIDQMYFVPNRSPARVPFSAYQYIKNHQQPGTVLEVPFVVRDGLQYLGDVHAQQIMRGAVLHNQPIIGGYLSRVEGTIFEYYRSLPFTGHIARITDKGNFYLYKEAPGTPEVSQFDASNEQLLKEMEFLDIAYVLIKQDELYSQIVSDKVVELGFKQIIEDEAYKLFYRSLGRKEFVNISFGDEDSRFFSGKNFSAPENDFRWGMNKSSSVFIKTYDTQNQQMDFEIASFYAPQKITIYLNNQLLGEKNISIDRNRYQIQTKNNLIKGLNRIDIIYSNSFRPSDVVKNSLDERALAIKFYSLQIK